MHTAAGAAARCSSRWWHTKGDWTGAAVLAGRGSSGFPVAWTSRASVVGIGDDAVATTDEWSQVRGSGRHKGLQQMGGCGAVAGRLGLTGLAR
jgi:hypothetical protein